MKAVELAKSVRLFAFLFLIWAKFSPIYHIDRTIKETGKLMQDLSCTNPGDFLILNISSLQLIPVNMIVYRQQYGSVSPTSLLTFILIKDIII